MFLSLEGAEGSGKSTQAQLIATHLRSLGRDPLLVREPGGTAIGEAIRDLLLSPDHAPSALTETLLYTAARAQLVGEVVRPALASGRDVIADRFLDSTLAYQGFGRGLPLDDLRRLQMLATGGLQPHLTLLFDLEVVEGLRRARGDGPGDRLEREDVDFHRRLREGYLALAAAEPGRISVVDARGTREEVFSRAIAVIAGRLESRGILTA